MRDDNSADTTFEDRLNRKDEHYLIMDQATKERVRNVYHADPRTTLSLRADSKAYAVEDMKYNRTIGEKLEIVKQERKRGNRIHNKRLAAAEYKAFIRRYNRGDEFETQDELEEYLSNYHQWISQTQGAGKQGKHNTHFKLLYDTLFPEERCLEEKNAFSSDPSLASPSHSITVHTLKVVARTKKEKLEEAKSAIKRKVESRESHYSSDKMIEMLKVLGQMHCKERHANMLLTTTGLSARKTLERINKEWDVSQRKLRRMEDKISRTQGNIRKPSNCIASRYNRHRDRLGVFASLLRNGCTANLHSTIESTRQNLCYKGEVAKMIDQRAQHDQLQARRHDAKMLGEAKQKEQVRPMTEAKSMIQPSQSVTMCVGDLRSAERQYVESLYRSKDVEKLMNIIESNRVIIRKPYICRVQEPRAIDYSMVIGSIGGRSRNSIPQAATQECPKAKPGTAHRRLFKVTKRNIDL